MSVWGSYDARIKARGADRRDTALKRERRILAARMPSSLTFHTVIIDGREAGVSIISTEDADTKTLCSLPGGDLPHGGYVEWMGCHWLITQRDAGTEVYTKATMRRCNYRLRWISDDGKIIERQCIVEDGTKYLTGEHDSSGFVATRGDTRIFVTLPKDKYTVRLRRANRFLIDDYDSPTVLAYELTKPYKLGGTYGEGGVMSFIMQECNTEDSDNFELHIANYYDYFPRKDETGDAPPDDEDETDGETDGQSEGQSGKRVWI